MKLKTPIVVDGREVKDVTVTEPTFDDIAQIGAPEDAATTAEKMGVRTKSWTFLGETMSPSEFSRATSA